MAVTFAVHDRTSGSLVADRVEVADSLWGRFRGLMGRASLPDGHGLWLAGTNNIHMFFMRFAIDAIFVAPGDAPRAWRVVAIREALPPWRGIVWYVRGANGCLELPSGTASRAGVKVGDTLEFVEPPVAGTAA